MCYSWLAACCCASWHVCTCATFHASSRMHLVSKPITGKSVLNSRMYTVPCPALDSAHTLLYRDSKRYAVLKAIGKLLFDLLLPVRYIWNFFHWKMYIAIQDYNRFVNDELTRTWRFEHRFREENKIGRYVWCLFTSVFYWTIYYCLTPARTVCCPASVHAVLRCTIAPQCFWLSIKCARPEALLACCRVHRD